MTVGSLVYEILTELDKQANFVREHSWENFEYISQDVGVVR